MLRRNVSAKLPELDLLKLDKDAFVSPDVDKKYIRNVLDICRGQGVQVLKIKSTLSRHGRHYYIKIDPAVDARTANNLQYLLGDDAKRVAFNKARIESGLDEWNKLFEVPGRKLRTIYKLPNCQSSKSLLNKGSKIS
jgi:hypothetical protein